MSPTPTTPWHRRSFDRFVEERLPQLLAERLPLTGYQARSTGPYTCSVRARLTARDGDVEIKCDIPQPDEDGVFLFEANEWVVVPLASSEDLDVATIRCVGEQFHAFVSARLGEAPPDLPWDETLARAWLPLDDWADEFLVTAGQRLDRTNWLSRHTHLRRLIIAGRERVLTPSQFGRTCPFETPEGPNIGRVLTIAVGAEIRDGRLIVVDGRPEATLGPSASMIPFLEHTDPNRLLMGANMLRQWLVPPDPEPALVQTGNEPDAPGVWCGRNLLTAFMSWEAGTFESGIVISESCARRLSYPEPVELGDKMSNRHGAKGVVSRIMPDDEMPRLADGTPVEAVFSFYRVHSRCIFGQIREALLGRIAHAERAPVVVPRFAAPSEGELRARAAAAGLPTDGMEVLTGGRDGSPFERPCAVGWVYWGRLWHRARRHLVISTAGEESIDWGELEHYALRRAGAVENVREVYNTQASGRAGADALGERLAAGAVEQAGPPAALFSDVAGRLAAAGIRAELAGERLAFHWAAPDAPALRLACAVAHPWLRERSLTAVGARPEMPEYADLVEANSLAERMLASGVPGSLAQRVSEQLSEQVRRFCDALLTPEHLQFHSRPLFAGRAVIAPAGGLQLDELALPEEMAWSLFAPLISRELGGWGTESGRTARAEQALDEIMARSWVIVSCAPALSPAAMLAFHPVRRPGPAVHLHPLATGLLNADFDGDRVEVLLPVTEAGQREAGERLTVEAHLRREPELLGVLIPSQEAAWGLAWLSLTDAGRQEITALAGVDLSAGGAPLTPTQLGAAMAGLLESRGVPETLAVLERLMQRGFEAAEASGASINPFPGTSLTRPPEPDGDDTALWERYVEELAEQIISRTDWANDDLGPQLLALRSNARSHLTHLAWLLGPQGLVTDVAGQVVAVRHGYAEGLTSQEMYATVARARVALAELFVELDQMCAQAVERARPRGLDVLARAMRARHPGLVFARAAASGEMDPLTDLDSRLFVGLGATPPARASPAQERSSR